MRNLLHHMRNQYLHAQSTPSHAQSTPSHAQSTPSHTQSTLLHSLLAEVKVVGYYGGCHSFQVPRPFARVEVVQMLPL